MVKDIAKILINQRENKVSASLYYWLQIIFSFNSNRIEGSTLSEKQTQQVFDTGTIFADENGLIVVDDVLETSNHFRMFDYVLDTIDVYLTSEYLFKLHTMLKRGTKSELDSKMNVGGFKQFPNQIGSIEAVQTTLPAEVPHAIQSLLEKWNADPHSNLLDFAKFHYRFETIHPFSDGNGIIGRLILFKELCKADLMPLVIRESNKPFYLRGLKKFEDDDSYLVDTLGAEQDYYTQLVERFLEI